jgi:hypothetical protein
MRKLISSYTRFACAVYGGEVKGEVGTRSIVPKHVVDFYAINNTYLFHQIVVLDIRYIPI